MQLSLVCQLTAATPMKSASYFGQLAPELRERAIAACGIGCDHAIGERIAAIVDFTGKEGYFLGGLVTDHAFAWRMPARGSVRWASVASLQVKTGLLHKQVAMQMLDGSLVEAPDITEIAPLVQMIARYAPADRVPRPQPLIAPTGDDPSGARGAAADMIRPDARHQLLFELVDRQLARGALDVEAARDLAGRISLLHRTSHFGRGRHDGAWMTALGPRDLLWVLGSILGVPHGARITDDVLEADFPVPAAWLDGTAIQGRSLVSLNPAKSVGRAIGNQMASSWLAGHGIGGELDRIRVGAGRHAQWTLLGIDAVHQVSSWPLYARNAGVLALLHGALLLPEGRTLLLRLLFGRDPPPATLAATPAAQVATALRGLGLETDLRWFGFT